MKPGEILTASSDIIANAGRRTVEVVVANAGDRPVQVGAHYHFFEVNKALKFDRGKAFGMRLNIPSGTTMRFDPSKSSAQAVFRSRTILPWEGLKWVDPPHPCRCSFLIVRVVRTSSRSTNHSSSSDPYPALVLSGYLNGIRADPPYFGFEPTTFGL